MCELRNPKGERRVREETGYKKLILQILVGVGRFYLSLDIEDSIYLKHHLDLKQRWLWAFLFLSGLDQSVNFFSFSYPPSHCGIENTYVDKPTTNPLVEKERELTFCWIFNQVFVCVLAGPNYKVPLFFFEQKIRRKESEEILTPTGREQPEGRKVLCPLL